MADIAIHVVRPDSVPFEPVRIGPVLSSSGVRIYRKNNKTDDRNVDILEVVDNFDSELYYCFGVTLFLLLAAMTSAQFIMHEKTTFKNLFFDVVELLQEIVFLIFDQEYLEPKQWSLRFLWTPFNFFVFVAIFGYLMNLMSSDQVASVPVDAINRLEDLQEQKWRSQNVTPWILKNLFFHSAFRHTSKVSREGARLNEVRSRQDLHFVDLAKIFADGDSMTHFLAHLMKNIENGQMALLLTDFIMNAFLVPAGCQIDSKATAMLHESDESFANGVLTNYFYKQYPQALVSYNEQRLRTAIEAELVIKFLKDVAGPLIGNLVPLTTGLPVVKCMSKFSEKPDERPDLIVQNLLGLRSVFKFIAFGVCLTIIVLIIEVLFHQVRLVIHKRQRKRNAARLEKIVDQMQRSRRLKWRHHSMMPLR